MNPIDCDILWRQFGAAIDSFAHAVRSCPDDLWEEQLWPDRPDQWVMVGFSKFWYQCYHSLFWLDLYLTGEEEERFAPPEPYMIVEMREGEVLPPVYTREELLAYLAICRQKCRDTLAAVTDDQAYRLCRYPWGEVTWWELQLYNMRHVVEHGAELHLFLGQRAGMEGKWVARAD